MKTKQCGGIHKVIHILHKECVVVMVSMNLDVLLGVIELEAGMYAQSYFTCGTAKGGSFPFPTCSSG